MEVSSVSDMQRAFYRLEWAPYLGLMPLLGAHSPLPRHQPWLELILPLLWVQSPSLAVRDNATNLRNLLS